MTDEQMNEIALRFDGYLFLERELRGSMETIFAVQAGQLSENENINHAACFFLQRYLCKWGGEQLPDDSEERCVFRKLCEHLKDKPAPKDYHLEW